MSTPESAEFGAAISPPDQQKILELWMERSGAPALGARPREPCSASSAKVRALRANRLRSPLSFEASDSLLLLALFNDSDPLIAEASSPVLRHLHGSSPKTDGADVGLRTANSVTRWNHSSYVAVDTWRRSCLRLSRTLSARRPSTL